MLDAVVCTVTILFVFRAQCANHFQMLFGEPYDGNIAISILEHWRAVFVGHAHWNVTSYFYPHPDTLGYNDGYFLYALPYAALRGVGLDMYRAAESGNIVVKSIGFFAFLGFARGPARLSVGWSVLGAVLFTIANNAFANAFHVQLLSMALAPLLAWLACRFCRGLQRGDGLTAVCAGGAAALLYAGWLMTAFYTAWFFGLFGLFATIMAGTLFIDRRGVSHRWRIVWPIGPVALIFAVAAVPFLLTYLPKVRETGLYDFASIRVFVPGLLDLLNVGPANMLFGRLVASLQTRSGLLSMGTGELMMGVPPILAGFGIAGAIAALRHGRGDRYARSCFAAGGALLLSLAVLIRVGDWSLWQLVFVTVPGARGIRVVSRDLLILVFPLTVFAMQIAARLTRTWPVALTAMLVVALIVEQINVTPPVFLDRRQGLALIQSVPPAPTACTAFYVGSRRVAPLNGTPEIDSLYHHNVDAMLISSVIGLPTINGFSSFNPPDWNFADPGRADYRLRIQTYARDHGLVDRLCGLDLAHRVWSLPKGD